MFHLLTLLLTLLAQNAHCFAFDGYAQSGGITRLLGSSFGLIGTNTTFDYVIVGGGTSGLVVAERLAEDSRVSVAVIEAGSFYELDNSNISQIPAFCTRFSGHDTAPGYLQPLIDWNVITTPQKQLSGQKIFYSQGKCLGGSSARNYLDYQRGTAGTYDQWAELVGDQSYSFNKVLPYFKKSVHFTAPDYSKRGPGSPNPINIDLSAYRAGGGPLQVSYSNFWPPMMNSVNRAFETIGLSAITGLNSGKLIGFAEFAHTIDPQAATRSSSESSFLRQALKQGNLQIYQRTMAKSITFGDDISANGVVVETAGVSYKLSAAKEVIVAAGAFRSPQLLMVSGIGPALALKEFNIPVLVDLPGVGQNLHDQPFFGTTYTVNVTTSTILNRPDVLEQATRSYLANQTGILAGSGAWLVGWEKLPQSLRQNLSAATLSALAIFPSDWPELELLPLPGAGIVPGPNDPTNYASFSVASLAFTSRGNVTIQSADTNDNPIVNPNWLSTTVDREVAVQAFKRIRQLAAATSTTIEEYSPGPSVATDAQILEWIQSTLAPFHHASATCSMGKSDDPNAVVDSHGKVLGARNLRIVDISTFPLLPPGHPQATVYMLAEKMADNIKSGN